MVTRWTAHLSWASFLSSHVSTPLLVSSLDHLPDKTAYAQIAASHSVSGGTRTKTGKQGASLFLATKQAKHMAALISLGAGT